MSLDIKFKGRDQTMKKILIVVVTTLGLVVGMGGALGTAEAAKKPSKFKVKAEVSASRIISGQTVLVTGSVKPTSIGRNVILQKRYKKRKGDWKKVDVARVRADGVFQLSDQPTTSRKRFYRVVKKAGDGHRKGVSKKMKVTIEPWDGRVDVKLFWETGADLNLVVDRSRRRRHLSRTARPQLQWRRVRHQQHHRLRGRRIVRARLLAW